MKGGLVLFCLVLQTAVHVTWAQADQGQRADSRRPSASATGELVPTYERHVLPNGLTLLLLEHHELPLVHFEVLLRAGSVLDPPGQEGLANITLSLLRKGTAKRTAEAIAEELDFLGGTLDLDVGFEDLRIAAQFLAKDVDPGLALLSDLLLHPTFPEDELRKTIDLEVNGIRDLKDNPRFVIGQYYEGFLFGNHALGRPTGGTETSLPTLKQADVQRFHSSYVRPNRAIVAVTGDFATADMKKRIESAFSGWKRRLQKTSETPDPKPVRGRQVLLVDKPDATQTYFRIGNVGVAKGNPETPALNVVNTVFGGRFTSWLMTELRTKSGLSYSAFSRFTEHRIPGTFYLASFTGTEDTGKAIDLALLVLERLHKDGLSKEELDSAQNYIRGQFPPRYETTGQLAATIAELEFFGLDRGYINKHTERTDTITIADAKRVISKHYPLQDLVLVLVGNADQVRETASKYGKLTEKRVSDPGF